MMFSVPLEINIGVITTWSGAIANIPPGWVLCDGTNGTPDLREKFVQSTGPIFAVGDEGGTSVHDHDFTSDTHSHPLGGSGSIDTPAAGDRQPNTNIVSVSGTTNLAVGLPPLYTLAYIQFNGV